MLTPAGIPLAFVVLCVQSPAYVRSSSNQNWVSARRGGAAGCWLLVRLMNRFYLRTVMGANALTANCPIAGVSDWSGRNLKSGHCQFDEGVEG